MHCFVGKSIEKRKQYIYELNVPLRERAYKKDWGYEEWVKGDGKSILEMDEILMKMEKDRQLINKLREYIFEYVMWLVFE